MDEATLTDADAVAVRTAMLADLAVALPAGRIDDWHRQYGLQDGTGNLAHAVEIIEAHCNHYGLPCGGAAIEV